jgi:hypothetical protein
MYALAVTGVGDGDGPVGGIRMASFPPQPPINNMVHAVTAGSTWRRVSLMLFKNHHTESFQSSEVICRMMLTAADAPSWNRKAAAGALDERQTWGRS